MYDVITFGSATVDAFAMTDAEMISFTHNGNKEEFIAYLSGSKILIENLDFQIGGGGTNTAVSFARLGLRTGFCGCIGKDDNAESILALLKKEKIDFLGSCRSGQSGYSVILDSHHEDRTILTFKGVNNDLRYADLDKSQLKAGWFYFSSLMGESYKTFVKLTAYAKKNKIKVAFNPSSYLAKKGLKSLAAPIKSTDLLVLNKEEAQLILGKEDECSGLAKKLAKVGPKTVVVTDGKRGATCYSAKQKKTYFMPPKNVRIKETTGAGDAFASAFLAGLILEDDICFALSLAGANAASVITHVGAKNRLLTLAQAKKRMKVKPKVSA